MIVLVANLTLFEIALLVLCAVLTAVLLAIMWWRIAGERVKALIAGWLALPLLWKIVLPVVFGAFVLHGSVKRGDNVANVKVLPIANTNTQLETGTGNWQHSHNGNIQQGSSTLRTTGFEVDSANRSLGFEVAWDDDLFNHTLSRNIFLYASTNLVLKRWSLFDVYPMPEETNGYSI